MRMQEYALHFDKSADAIHSVNRAGEVLNTYIQHVQPLELWRRHGLRQAEYEAGIRYGALWREVCRPKSPPHSDPTRVVVDGNSAAPEGSWPVVSDSELGDAQRAIGDEETVTMLNRLTGLEDWPHGDKRRFKRKCRKGLERLAQLWRRR